MDETPDQTSKAARKKSSPKKVTRKAAGAKSSAAKKTPAKKSARRPAKSPATTVQRPSPSAKTQEGKLVDVARTIGSKMGEFAVRTKSMLEKMPLPKKS